MKRNSAAAIIRSVMYFTLPVIFLGTAWIIGRFFRLDLIPREVSSLQVTGFEDGKDHSAGRSKINALTTAGGNVKCSFRIDSGFAYPYAGIVIASPSSSFMNLHRYNTMRLAVTAETAVPLQISLLTFVDGITTSDDLLSKRYNSAPLYITKGKLTRNFSFSSFRTPQWWYERWQRHPYDEGETPDYGKTVSIRIQNSPFTPRGKTFTFEVHEMVIYYNMFPVYKLLLLLSGVFYLMIGVWHLSRRYHTNQKVAAIIGYEKLPVTNHEDNDLQKITAFISSNYTDPGISLKGVVKHTGVSEHRVSQLLTRHYKKDFKGYLKTIRLSEAHRLLGESDRQVTEIAFLVGFNYLSSFSRAFKKYYNVTPMDVRKREGDLE
jgi:AraC-like DNA-binding protein